MATTPRERGSSTSESFATCSVPLNRDSGDSSHAHTCLYAQTYVCIDCCADPSNDVISIGTRQTWKQSR